MAYLTPESKRALSAAVEAIELASSAEVVVVMRPDSTPLLAPCALAASVAGVLGLAFLVFSPWPFSNAALLLDTVLVGLAGAALCKRSGLVRRLFTPRKLAEYAALQAARAEFLERGVSETRERSGLLIYVSQIERCAAVVADRGILARVDAASWQAAVARLAQSVRSEADGVRLAACIDELKPLLASALPRRADDINELADGLVAT